MRIEVWSDFNCPWCWLGKHDFEKAVDELGVGDRLEVRFRSYELSPGLDGSQPLEAYLGEKYGDASRVAASHARLMEMGERAGLRYDFARAVVANTFDAHRVHHLAEADGVGPAVAERFMKARHAEGADLGDRGVVRRLAVEAGLDGARVDATLVGGGFADEVRADEREAQVLGITGVPAFVFDRRFLVSGAQPVEVFREALTAALAPGVAP